MKLRSDDVDETSDTDLSNKIEEGDNEEETEVSSNFVDSAGNASFKSLSGPDNVSKISLNASVATSSGTEDVIEEDTVSVSTLPLLGCP